MKLKIKQDKRNYIIIALCLILVIMGVGYAAFSSLLTINGTASITNSWCVGFDNTKTDTMEITKGISTGTEPAGTMTYSGTACGTNLVPNSSLSARFYQPGDQIEYTLTIVNKSTVTAAIKSILVDNESITSNTTKKKDNITYIIEMPETTTLAPNASTTMKVIAKFQNETDISGPYSGETKSIEVKINAEQDDGNGGFTPMPSNFTGTIYRNNANTLLNGLTMNGETIVWYAPELYSSAEEAYADHNIFSSKENCNQTNYGDECASGTITLSAGSYETDASLLNKNYYLKHDVVDNIITASYACFVTDTEHCMQGGNSSYATVNKSLIQEQVAWFTGQTPAGDCTIDDEHYASCGYSSLVINAHYNGLVYAEAPGNGKCEVSDMGYSGCDISDSGNNPDNPFDDEIK